jgi:hypothetical protein
MNWMPCSLKRPCQSNLSLTLPLLQKPPRFFLLLDLIFCKLLFKQRSGLLCHLVRAHHSLLQCFLPLTLSSPFQQNFAAVLKSVCLHPVLWSEGAKNWDPRRPLFSNNMKTSAMSKYKKYWRNTNPKDSRKQNCIWLLQGSCVWNEDLKSAQWWICVKKKIQANCWRYSGQKLPNFHDMNPGKICLMAKKWQTTNEPQIDVKTTCDYFLHLFCVDFIFKNATIQYTRLPMLSTYECAKSRRRWCKL